MRDRTFKPKKAGTSSFSNSSLVSPHTPTLANAVRGFGLPTNNVIQTQTAESINQQQAPSADEQSLLSPAIEQRSFAYDFSRIPLHRPQAKLTMGEPGDKYEQEADWMANQVMRMVVPDKLNTASVQPGQDSLQCKSPQPEQDIKDIPERIGNGFVTKEQPFIQREEAPQNTEISQEIEPQEEELPHVAGSLLSPLYNGPLTVKIIDIFVLLQSPVFFATGSVLLDSRKTAADEYEIGFVQNLVNYENFKTTHRDKNGKIHIKERFYHQVPMRDGEPEIEPWYGPETVQSVNAENGATRMQDRPQVWPIVLQTSSGRQLVSTSGSDWYCSWLTLRHKASNKLQFLGWVLWHVNYDCTFNVTEGSWQANGGGKIEGQGKGQGPFTPLINGPVVNEGSDWTVDE
ncbi:hypothetical protein NIES2100_38700 [Calothrix sp. NIES-2100]|uniref:hypothetical protein n=1 Tax=Calothrix sp. NIES-2100 TaxID=1954172 RepID=UPI000B5F49E3|nr:hypothetical protein NIES2100_38700 [Calothrix sp. NIES-2100]